MKKQNQPALWVLGLACAFGLARTVAIHAEDWPRYRGADNLGVWNETGIVETLPPNGLPVSWRTPVKLGYSGPTVSNGRVFVTDFEYTKRPFGTERALALDEKTGKILWTQAWEADYTGINWDNGPGAPPTVDGDVVFTLGRAGTLTAFNVKTGEILWRKNYVKEYNVHMEKWGFDYGFASPPLVDGDRLICLVGGEPDAMVVAFNKRTGAEMWRSLQTNVEPGYSPPSIITQAGVRQLIIWDTGHLSSLDPVTGKVYWTYVVRSQGTMTIMTPVFIQHKDLGDLLMVSSYFNGSTMLQLPKDKPGPPKLLWKGNSDSELVTDGLHALMATPVVIGDYIYGFCSFGQFRAIKLATGERVWENDTAAKVERHGSGFLIRNGDRFFINNDQGVLIIAKLAPDGFHEISRTQLIKATFQQRHLVNWTPPAFANKHIITRNDEEIISFNAAANGQGN